MRHQLKSQLESTQRRYDEMFAGKVKLENSMLDLELHTRELRYQLEQERENLRSSEATVRQLKEQVERIEAKYSRFVRGCGCGCGGGQS